MFNKLTLKCRDNKLALKYKNIDRGTKVMFWLWITTFIALITFVVIVGIYTAQAGKTTGGLWTFIQTAKAKTNVAAGIAVPAAPKDVPNLDEWLKTPEGKKLSVFWLGSKFIAKAAPGAASASNLIAGFGLLFVITLFMAIFVTAFVVYKKKQQGGSND